jgi:Ca2+-binding EF-hand superfamily protein
MKKVAAIFTLVLSAGLIGRAQAADPPASQTPSGTTPSGTTQPGTKQSGKTQSGKTQSGKTQPGATQSGKTQPGKTQPGETPSNELFKKLDVNRDGVLTASEIPKEQQKAFERLLRIGDTNKDGRLSREEFDAAMPKTEKPVADINATPGVNPGARGAKAKADPKQVFARLDKNKDGKLTSDEVADHKRIKAAFDRLGKDSLTLDELTAALQSGDKPRKVNQKKLAKKATKMAAKQAAKGTAPASTTAAKETAVGAHELPEFARLLDTNHDGRLSREELSKAGEMFDRLDRNHDGALDAKELTELPAVTSTAEATTTTPPAGKHGKGAGAAANLAKLLQKADKDSDGKLSMEEAPPGMKKHFAKIDTNSDGFLDKAELEAWFRRHRKMAHKTPKATTPDNTPTNPS